MANSINSGNGQWKWIAGILAALMVGFLPGYISNRDAPTSEQFTELENAQQANEVKLALLAAQNKAILEAMRETRRRVIALQAKFNHQ